MSAWVAPPNADRMRRLDRLYQAEIWLRKYFPTPYPVRVLHPAKIAASPGDPPSVRASGDDGEIYWRDGRIVIRISRKRCRDVAYAVDTLQHEWAHAVTMPNERIYRARRAQREDQEHPDEFWLTVGRMYRGWVDLGGCSEALGFDPRDREARR